MLFWRQSRSRPSEQEKNPVSPYRNQTRFLGLPALSLVAIPTTLSRLPTLSGPMRKDAYNKDSNLLRCYAVSAVSPWRWGYYASSKRNYQSTMHDLNLHHHCCENLTHHLTATTPSHAIPFPKSTDAFRTMSVLQCSYSQHLSSSSQGRQLYIFLYWCFPDQRSNGHDFRFLQWYYQGFGLGMWRCVVRCFPTFWKKVLPSASRSDGYKRTDFAKKQSK
jgi:hypothetical protein